MSLIFREQVVGLIYLDNKVVKGLFQERDKIFISSAANILAAAIEAARSVKIELEKKDLERDLQLTGAVQGLLLPRQDQFEFEQFQVTGYYKSAAQAGGDWWWSERLPDGSLIAFLGDVTGHGAASAMVTAIVAGIYYTFRHTVLSEQTFNSNPQKFNPNKAIEEFLYVADKNLHTHLDGEFNMAYTAVHLSTDQTLTIWGAGSPPAVAISDNAEQTEDIVFLGHMLGTGNVKENTSYVQKSFRGRLFLYSDGLLEVPFSPNRLFSENSISKHSFARKDQDLAEFQNEIAAKVEENLKVSALKDDVSFIMIENKNAVVKVKKAA